MYFKILKKDLKRKKTMNVILLLFVMLSVLFASSSVNNVVSVVHGIDYYFAQAGMGDYFWVCSPESSEKIQELLAESPDPVTCSVEDTVMITADNILQDGEKCMNFTTAGIVQPITGSSIHFFDMENNIVDTVEPGTLYITGSHALNDGLEAGETITFSIGDYQQEFTYAGPLKDALFGSEMMGNPRFLFHPEDFEQIAADPVAQQSKLQILMATSDAELDVSETANLNDIMFQGGTDLIRTTYVMNMIVAGMILLIGIGLILVSFVILRFTIGFTIAEEFHEIGVMKAVGIRNSAIRSLYLVKYLGISLLGAVGGYLAGIPFGTVLIASVSNQMVLGNDSSVLIGILCSIAVVLIILSFCWSSTRKIKKLSPIDAVRSGQTGERFRKRSLLHLSKSRLNSTSFLALNDILSEPKQYSILTAVFTVCMLLVMILANTANTLCSPKTLSLLGTTESDVFIMDTTSPMRILSGELTVSEAEDSIAELLEQHQMPAEIKTECWYALPIQHGDHKVNVTCMQCKHTQPSDYTYTAGTAPQHPNEIAITGHIAEELGGVTLGDFVTININGKEQSFLVTAFFQCFNNLGECARLHPDVDIDPSYITNIFSFQANFLDHPDKATIADRIEQLQEIFGTDQILDAREFVNFTTGVSETIASVKNLVLLIALCIVVMISVLMERSFIAKEKAEIALQKALGFQNRSILLHRIGRFTLLMLVAAILSIALSTPLTNLVMDPIFSIMGTEGKIDYDIQPLEIYVFYPIVMIAVTTVSTWLTALYTYKIKASDTADME